MPEERVVERPHNAPHNAQDAPQWPRSTFVQKYTSVQRTAVYGAPGGLWGGVADGANNCPQSRASNTVSRGRQKPPGGAFVGGLDGAPLS